MHTPLRTRICVLELLLLGTVLSSVIVTTYYMRKHTTHSNHSENQVIAIWLQFTHRSGVIPLSLVEALN